MAAAGIDPRRQLLIAFMAVAAGVSAFSRFFVAPLQSSITKASQQIQKYETQVRDLSEKLPPIGDLTSRVDKLEKSGKEFESEINEIEKMLPSRYGTSKFIAQVTELAKEVKIESVKQRIEKEEVYSRLYLEIQFLANYAAAVRYVASVEAITPYLKVEEMTISEPKPKGEQAIGGGSPMKLVVSCLLGDSSAETELKKSKDMSGSYKEIRDLLGSKAKPSNLLRESEFRVEGITYNATNPTAIINGDVYQVGSELGGYRITAIGPDSLILSDGSEEHILNVKR